MKLKTILNSESPFMNGVNKFNLLICMNLLVLLCSIPIITAGAAFAAMHEYLFRLQEDTEGALVKSFFRSFRKNFIQATIVWMILLAGFIIAGIDIFISINTEWSFPLILKIVFIEIVLLFYMVLNYCFPVIASFECSNLNVFKNAFLIGAGMIKKSLVIMAVNLLPWLLLMFFPAIGWISILIGIAGPAYIATCLYAQEFREIKERITMSKGDENQKRG